MTSRTRNPSDAGDSPEVDVGASRQRGWRSWPPVTSRNPAEGRESVFELDEVTVSYSGKPAIRDVDLRVHGTW